MHDHSHHRGHKSPTAEKHRHPTQLERDQHLHDPYTAGAHPPQGGHHAPEHHAHMVADFKRRFWISLVLTVPVLVLDEAVHMALRALGLDVLVWSFPGAEWIVLALSTIVYIYGGWPFLSGLAGELRKRQPGMMTLISVAITAAYAYSAAVVLGLRGMPFFWELVTLIDIMLLGHWIEMRSVMGASAALESLVRLMPSEAHRLRPDGSTEDVAVTARGRPVLCLEFLALAGRRCHIDGSLDGHRGDQRPVSPRGTQ